MKLTNVRNPFVAWVCGYWHVFRKNEQILISRENAFSLLNRLEIETKELLYPWYFEKRKEKERFFVNRRQNIDL